MNNIKYIPIEYVAWKEPWNILEVLLEDIIDVYIIVSIEWKNLIMHKKILQNNNKYNITYVDPYDKNNFDKIVKLIIEKIPDKKIGIICNKKYMEILQDFLRKYK